MYKSNLLALHQKLHIKIFAFSLKILLPEITTIQNATGKLKSSVHAIAWMLLYFVVLGCGKPRVTSK